VREGWRDDSRGSMILWSFRGPSVRDKVDSDQRSRWFSFVTSSVLLGSRPTILQEVIAMKLYGHPHSTILNPSNLVSTMLAVALVVAALGPGVFAAEGVIYTFTGGNEHWTA
jgi:hypothetical protein